MKKINEMTSTELKAMAKELHIKNWWKMKKADLVTEIEKLQKAEKPATKKNKKKTEQQAHDVSNKSQKQENENIITLKELLPKNMKGSKARRILRNADIERPYKQWEWDTVEHADIIDKVKELLKGGDK